MARPGGAPAAQRVVDYRFALAGRPTQGGYLTGQLPAGATNLRLDGQAVRLDGARFALGFGRDAPGLAVLDATAADGTLLRQVLRIEPREWAIERIPSLSVRQEANPEYERRRAMEVPQVQAGKRAGAVSNGWTQTFRWPAAGRISGIYGSQRILGGVPRTPHAGVDIAAPAGTPFVAPADGVVTLARGPFLLEGNILMLDHGHGLVSSFLHLSAFDVQEGQRVRQGDVLGRIGTTGRSTGPHLHWALSLMRGDTDTRLDAELLVPPKVNGRTP